MTRVVVDSADPTPPYEQIRRQLAQLIETGTVKPGEKLPTVRKLAGDLRLAPGTVSRAYQELEAGGYVLTRRGAGTRVANRSPSARVRLEDLVDEFLARTAGLGFSLHDVVDEVRRQTLESDRR